MAEDIRRLDDRQDHFLAAVALQHDLRASGEQHQQVVAWVALVKEDASLGIRAGARRRDQSCQLFLAKLFEERNTPEGRVGSSSSWYEALTVRRVGQEGAARRAVTEDATPSRRAPRQETYGAKLERA